MNFLSEGTNVSIRDAIPDLILTSPAFNHNFFTDLLAPMLSALGDAENNQAKLYVNSGAPIRWSLMSLFMGDRSKQVQSQKIGSLEELQWKDFEASMNVEYSQEQKLVAYSLLASLSKLVIRDYQEGVVGEVASATDTVNYVKKDGKWTQMEKPSNLDEAYEQIELLTSGEAFFVANASAIGKVGDDGEFGLSMWMLPARYEFADDNERQHIKRLLMEKVRDVFSKDDAIDQVRPGGVSGVDEIWINFLKVGYFDNEEFHEVSDTAREDNFTFDNYLNQVKKWTNLTGEELSDGQKLGTAATVIGGPIYGLRRAAEKYIYEIKQNGERISKCKLIRKWIKDMSSSASKDLLPHE